MPRFTVVTRTQGNNKALKNGTVRPETFDPEFVEVSPLIHAFRRMVRRLEFDICELAFTTYLSAKAHGKAITALPIFLVRGLHHGAIAYNTRAGVRSPADLEGRLVGINRGYTVTTGVWARGILQDEYGVDLDRVTWVLSGDEHVAEYRPPANVVPVGDRGNLAEMVAAGELAATIGVATDNPHVAPLIDSPEEAAFDALRQNGLYPINHLIVVRDELLAEHPGLAADVFGAFAEAKERYVSQLRAGGISSPSAADRMYRRVMDILGDPLPYGVEPNRPMIDKLIDHAVRQHILPERPEISSLFHPSTLQLTA